MSEPRDEFERHFAQRYADYLEEGLREMDPKTVPAGVTADEPRRAGWLRMAMVGTATVAAAAVVTFVALGVLPKITGPVGTSSESPQASVGPSATLAPTPTATPSQSVAVTWPTVAPSEASVPSSLDGQGFAFWTLDERVPCPCGASTLRISTSTGSWEGIIDIPDAGNGPELQSTPAGPAVGRVLYVVDDGKTAHLMVEDARTGADTELTSTSLLIARLAIDPSGSTAYYLLFDRLTSAFQGLWAIPTNGGQPRPLSAVQATTTMATLAAVRVYTPQLAVSDDGSWIVFTDCQATSCEFHANHPDGTSEALGLANIHAGDTIVGIAGNLLIGSSDCPQATCDGFALDLRTGERWPLGGADQPFAPRQLIAGPHGPLVLGESEDYDQGLWHIEALDLTDGRRSSVFEATFQPGVTTVRLSVDYHPAGAAGAELPPGWFLIYRFTDAAAFLPPDYSAATAGAALETKLPFMKSSHP